MLLGRGLGVHSQKIKLLSADRGIPELGVLRLRGSRLCCSLDERPRFLKWGAVWERGQGPFHNPSPAAKAVEFPLAVMGSGPAKGRRGSAAFPIADHLLHRGTPRLRATCRLMHRNKRRARVVMIYSITSSAWASSDAGTSRPIAWAVARLTTNSNLVGCTTGRSAGLSPLRMRPA